MENKQFTVLSIEDNKPDFILLEKALHNIPNISLNIININNGQNALNFIYKKGEYKSSPTPDIIILDINLPSISGKEILKILKNDENYKMIPIIIYSTSDYYHDIEESYKLHANSYIVKACDTNELFHNISEMGKYWLTISEIPNIDNSYFIYKKPDIK